MNCYRIKNWSDHYENNRTRELQDLKWFPCPIQLSGDGYTLITEQKDGASIFGAWIATAELAATCEPRGTLVRSAGIPHDAASISRQTRMPLKIVEKMLSFCMLKCNWLELIDLQSGAIIPQEGAIIPQASAEIPPCIEGKGMEENIIPLSDIEYLYSLYPTRDINNKNRSTGKCSKDKDRLKTILKTKTKAKIEEIIKSYINECSRTPTYLKNFSVFLNNLPEAIEPPQKEQYNHPPDSYGKVSE